jgi:hypothetical protein
MELYGCHRALVGLNGHVEPENGLLHVCWVKLSCELATDWLQSEPQKTAVSILWVIERELEYGQWLGCVRTSF